MPKRKKVLILGGGFCGTRVALGLKDAFDVLLVDTKSYFEFTPGILRTIVDPEHLSRLTVDYVGLIGKGRFLKGKVEEAGPEAVRIDGRKHTFDYLVITLGSSYEAPFKSRDVVLTSRAKHLAEAHERCEQAKTILVIGGGIVGIEMVGELCDRYPDRRIVLCHGRGTLMPRASKKAQEYATRSLIKKGVELVFNTYIQGQDKYTFTTVEGRQLKADLGFLCTGIKPNTVPMKKTLADSLDERGVIVVNEHLQVKGQDHIFAGGDITNIKEEKLAQAAERHADIIIKNIRCHAKGRPLAHYQPKQRPMVISIGKWRGILQWKDFTLTGIIPALLKSLVEWKSMRHYR